MPKFQFVDQNRRVAHGGRASQRRRTSMATPSRSRQSRVKWQRRSWRSCRSSGVQDRSRRPDSRLHSAWVRRRKTRSPFRSNPNRDREQRMWSARHILSSTTRAVGTTRHVYAQIVDKKTGFVVGNIVTPVSVTLTARTGRRTSTWRTSPGRTRTPPVLRAVRATTTIWNCRSSARLRPYEDFTSFGVINISNVNLSMPVAGINVSIRKI